MEDSKQFEIADYSARIKRLLSRSRMLLDESGYEDIQTPTNAYDEDGPIKIVFAGQYSAGKSTILKALTGMDIEIGHGVTTESATPYEWNDLLVVDTPGIRTGIRPDHDEISMAAIASADVLVYVVTYAGFDDVIAEEFRRLLIDRDKAKEMILVVNQMGRADDKNSPRQREIIANDLVHVTNPYTPSQLHAVYIDAKSFLRGRDLEGTDEQRAQRLYAQGNFDDLINALNSFVTQRGMAVRLTTPLYQLRDALEKALALQHESSGDEDVDALKEKCLRERSILQDAMSSIRQSVKQLYRQAAYDIREEGRRLAEDIQDCKSEAEAEDLAKRASDRVDEIAEQCAIDIREVIKSQAERCQGELDEFYSTDLVINLQLRLSKKRNAGNPLIINLIQPELFARGRDAIFDMTAGVDAAANGLRRGAGSEMHELVLKVGHYFGHKFKPYEALKWTNKIEVAGKALGVFGVVLDLGLQAKSDIDQAKLESEQRSNRDTIRSSFNSIANDFEGKCSAELRRLLQEGDAFQPHVDALSKQLEAIEQLQIDRSATSKKLLIAAEECNSLIRDIHRSFSV